MERTSARSIAVCRTTLRGKVKTVSLELRAVTFATIQAGTAWDPRALPSSSPIPMGKRVRVPSLRDWFEIFLPVAAVTLKPGVAAYLRQPFASNLKPITPIEVPESVDWRLHCRLEMLSQHAGV